MRKNKNKGNERQWIPEEWHWQVMTEDNQTFKVDDDWVELNLVYNCRNWYIKQLEPQKLAKSKEETEWKDLPFGSSLKLSPQEDNENVSNTTNEKLETDSEIGITQFETTVKHKYLQKDHGDVCTVINLLNLMVYLEDDHAEKKLSPLLNEKDWNKYLKSINAPEKTKGYDVPYVMQFLRGKCGCNISKHSRVNVRKLDFWEIIVCQINPTHCVVIYRGMIFDANYEHPVTCNDENLSILANKPTYGDDDIFEMLCYKIGMKKEKAMKRKRA